MDTISTTEARQNLFRLIDNVTHSHAPCLITGKRGNAVLIGEDDWKAVQETLTLLSVPGMRASITDGMATPIAECDDTLDW